MKRKRKNTIIAVDFTKKRKKTKVFIVALLIFAFFYLYIAFLVTPLIISSSNSQVKVYANKSMNYAITEAMNQNVTYDDLIHIVTDSSGKISMLQANSIQINNLSKLIGRVTMAKLNELTKNPVLIPLGAFSGITIISGMGPKVAMETYPYGDVSCRFLSQFFSAGINQTQHKIYMSISCTINVVLPFRTLRVNASSDVLLCESVIIGDIPDTFFSIKDLSGLISNN